MVRFPPSHPILDNPSTTYTTPSSTKRSKLCNPFIGLVIYQIGIFVLIMTIVAEVKWVKKLNFSHLKTFLPSLEVSGGIAGAGMLLTTIAVIYHMIKDCQVACERRRLQDEEDGTINFSDLD